MQPGLSPPKQPEEASPVKTGDIPPLYRPQTWPSPHPEREPDPLGKIQPTESKRIYLKVQSALEEEPGTGVMLEAVGQLFLISSSGSGTQLGEEAEWSREDW